MTRACRCLAVHPSRLLDQAVCAYRAREYMSERVSERVHERARAHIHHATGQGNAFEPKRPTRSWRMIDENTFDESPKRTREERGAAHVQPRVHPSPSSCPTEEPRNERNSTSTNTTRYPSVQAEMCRIRPRSCAESQLLSLSSSRQRASERACK